MPDQARAGPAQQALTIDGWLPEQMANGSHGHWVVRQRKLKSAKLHAYFAAHRALWERVPGRVRLTVVLVFPQKRRRDTDNLYSRVKGLVDGLVKGGYIEDDNSDVLVLVVKAEVRPGIRQTELILEPIEAWHSPGCSGEHDSRCCECALYFGRGEGGCDCRGSCGCHAVPPRPAGSGEA